MAELTTPNTNISPEETPPVPLMLQAVVLFGLVVYIGVAWFNVVPVDPLYDYANYYESYVEARTGQSAYYPFQVGPSFLHHPGVLSFVSVLAGFGLLGEGGTAVVWLALSVAAYLGVLAWMAIKYRTLAWPGVAAVVLLFLGFSPLWETLAIGQINAFVVALLVGVFALAERGHDWAAGLLLAFAVILKASPIVFGLYFLVTWRWRSLIALGLGLAAFTALTVVQFGPRPIVEYTWMVQNIVTVPDAQLLNHSLMATLMKWFGPGVAVPAGWFQRIGLAGLGIAAGGLVYLRREHLTRVQRLWYFVLLLTIMTLASPLVWHSHSVFLVPGLFLLITAPEPWQRWVGVLAVLLIQSVRVWELATGYTLALSGLPEVLGQYALLIALAVTFFSAVHNSEAQQKPEAAFV